MRCLKMIFAIVEAKPASNAFRPGYVVRVEPSRLPTDKRICWSRSSLITLHRRNPLIRPESQRPPHTPSCVFTPADNERLFLEHVSKLLLAHSLLELPSQGLPLHSQLSLASVSALLTPREKENQKQCLRNI